MRTGMKTKIILDQHRDGEKDGDAYIYIHIYIQF